MSPSHATQRSIPSWALGGMAGLVVWLAAFAVFALVWFTDITRSLPDWFLENPFVNFVIHACAIVAVPIALGGWTFVWGDNGPPFPWMDDPVLNYAIGVGFCMIVGAALGGVIGGRSPRPNRRGATEADPPPPAIERLTIGDARFGEDPVEAIA